MHVGNKPIRTKGRASRWTTACKKVFEITKLNPQASKFKAGNYFFFVDKTLSIFIAEIIAVFTVSLNIYKNDKDSVLTVLNLTINFRNVVQVMLELKH